MKIKQIDARGKTCPLPVIEAKKALEAAESGTKVEVLVDNEIAVQNLQKMAVQKRYPAESQKIREGCYLVEITKNESAETDKNRGSVPAERGTSAAETENFEKCGCQPDLEKTVVVLASDEMGHGDPVLGRILMKGFVYALTEQERLPDTVLLYNGGAHLSCEGSDSLEDLKKLEEQGTEILTCGTCLNHYGLTEKLAVGSVTNMYQIAEILTGASKVVKP